MKVVSLFSGMGGWECGFQKINIPIDLSMEDRCYKKVNPKYKVYGRLDPSKPFPTITGQFYNFGSGCFGHPTEHRALALIEGLLAQGFPHDFKIPGRYSIKDAGLLIGNAVSPKVSEAFGLAILEAFKNV